eukprot:1674723-Pyramimonas_sp.AAC.2
MRAEGGVRFSQWERREGCGRQPMGAEGGVRSANGSGGRGAVSQWERREGCGQPMGAEGGGRSANALLHAGVPFFAASRPGNPSLQPQHVRPHAHHKGKLLEPEPGSHPSPNPLGFKMAIVKPLIRHSTTGGLNYFLRYLRISRVFVEPYS